MVHLQRHPEPEGLAHKKAAWTERWRTIHLKQSTKDWATAPAKKLLREALTSLAHGKCAYCEGRLGVTSYLEIEHHIAKTVNPDLVFEWTNLFPCCRLCNSKKQDINHDGALLKPDVDDPEQYLWVENWNLIRSWIKIRHYSGAP